MTGRFRIEVLLSVVTGVLLVEKAEFDALLTFLYGKEIHIDQVETGLRNYALGPHTRQWIDKQLPELARYVDKLPVPPTNGLAVKDRKAWIHIYVLLVEKELGKCVAVAPIDWTQLGFSGRPAYAMP